jgi:hypothetical protein
MPDATPMVPCSAGAPGTSATPLTFQRAVTLLDTMPGVNQRGAGLWVTEWRPRKNLPPSREQSDDLQGAPGAWLPLSLPELRRFPWRAALEAQHTVQQILAWSRLRRSHQTIAEHYFYQRRRTFCVYFHSIYFRP